MGGRPLDHHAEREDRVVLFGPEHLLDRKRDLIGARHVGDRNIVRVAAVAHDRIHRAVQQSADEEVVEPRAHDPELEPPGLQAAFKHRTGRFVIRHIQYSFPILYVNFRSFTVSPPSALNAGPADSIIRRSRHCSESQELFQTLFSAIPLSAPSPASRAAFQSAN